MNRLTISIAYSGNLPGVAPSAPERLFQNLLACPDVSMAELAVADSKEKMRSTTIIVGEASPQSIADALTTEASKRRED
ncbi:MAG: hypothetical protein AAF583_02660 [Pseudomonadota bacterium]